MSNTLILVAPGLLAQPPQALARAPSLTALARLAHAPHVERHGLARALVALAGGRDEAAIAPLAALGAGLAPGDDYLLIADPVLLAADRDDVVLLARVDDLAAGDAATLAAMLDRHFAADGLRFGIARPDAWFARCARVPDVAMTPFDAAVGRGIYPHLPQGRDARTWRRWQNEIQMLLHEHPVNTVREATGKAPVRGIWFWGGGRLADVESMPAVNVVAAPGRIGDLACGIARHARGSWRALEASDAIGHVLGEAQNIATRDAARSTVVVVDAIERAADVEPLETRWLAPALRLLSRRRIESFQLLADGNGTAARWTAAPPTFWRRLAQHADRAPFTVPAPLES